MPEDLDVGLLLAVLRNDMSHLTATIECLRGDLQKMAVAWGGYRTLHRETSAELLVAVHKLQFQMGILKWVLGVVTTAVLALVIGWARKAIGL